MNKHTQQFVSDCLL